MAYFDPFKTQRAIIADRRLSSSETVTAFVILANRISKTGECKLAVPDIAAGTRLCGRSVQRAIAGLVEKNVLRVDRTGRKSQFTFLYDDTETDEITDAEGVTQSHIRGDTKSPQNGEGVTQSHIRGDTKSPLSLNIDKQSFNKENPSHARTSAHAREADIAPWEEEPELPDPETLPDSEMQSATTWEDLQEADALMQAEEASSPTRHLQKKCPYEALKDLYHEALPELEPVRIDTERRKRDVQELWREVVKRQECRTVADGLLQFRRYFEKVRRSRIFEQAVKSDLPWQVDFSWLMTSKTFVKFVEGGYD